MRWDWIVERIEVEPHPPSMHGEVVQSWMKFWGRAGGRRREGRCQDGMAREREERRRTLPTGELSGQEE